MSGDLGKGVNNITNLANPSEHQDAATKLYVDNATNAIVPGTDFIKKSGDDMTGILGMGGNRITNVANAVNPQDAITKAQLDAATNNLAGNVDLQKAYENGNTITTSAGEGDVTVAGTQGLTVSADEGIYVTGNDGIYVQEGVEVDGLTAMDGGATLEGGALQVNGNQNIQMNNDGGNTGQINMDDPTGDESIRLNAAGKIVIYSGGSLALEFE